MRVLSFSIGVLLIIAGASAVIIADQQREQAVVSARLALEDAEERLASAQELNLTLAESLTALRSTIAEQERDLADTEGFLP